MCLFSKHHPFGSGLVVYLCTLIFVISCNKPSPNVRFSFAKNCYAETCEYTFKNSSSDADIYRWDFGDGVTSSDPNPIHSYSMENDYYIVTLKAINIATGKEAIVRDSISLLTDSPCESVSSFICAKKIEYAGTIKDKIDPTTETNFYQFTPNKPGPAKIVLASVPSGSTAKLIVYSQPNEESKPVCDTFLYEETTASFYIGPLNTSKYYIKLNVSPASDRSYNLSVIPDNGDEHEINNSFSTATPVSFGVNTNGTILPKNDADYFSFHTSRMGPVEVTVFPIPHLTNNKSLNVSILSDAAESTVVTFHLAAAGDMMALTSSDLDTGTHYIRLVSEGESTEQYMMQVNFDESDPYEYNNTFDSARTIMLGDVLSASAGYTGDVDCYAFTAAKDGPLNVMISKEPQSIYYMAIEIYDEPNTSFVYDKGTIESQPDVSTFVSNKNLAAGKLYYLRVISFLSGTNRKSAYKAKIYQ